MMHRRKWAWSTAGLLLVSTPAVAAVVDFNTGGDLANNFFLASSAGTANPSTNYVETNSIGVGSSRAIDTVGISTTTEYITAIYKNQSFPFNSANDAIEVSAFAEKRNDSNFNNQSSTFLRVGISTGNSSSNDRFTGGSSGSSVALEVYNNLATGSDFTDVIFRFQNKVNGAAPVFATLGGGTPVVKTLTNGNWYKLTAVITNLGSGSVQVSGTLEDYGVDGTSSPTLIQTITPSTVTNAFITADSTVYGGFIARQDGGSDAVDNFAVVPEPAFAGLALVGVISLLRRRRLH